MPDSTPLPQDRSEVHISQEFTDSLRLLARAREGDSEALGELLSHYSERVLRVVRIRMGARVRGLMESSDLLQMHGSKALSFPWRGAILETPRRFRGAGRAGAGRGRRRR